MELPTLQSVCNDENQKYRFSIFSAAPSQICVVLDERMGEFEIGKTSQKIKIIFQVLKTYFFPFISLHIEC